MWTGVYVIIGIVLVLTIGICCLINNKNKEVEKNSNHEEVPIPQSKSSKLRQLLLNDHQHKVLDLAKESRLMTFDRETGKVIRFNNVAVNILLEEKHIKEDGKAYLNCTDEEFDRVYATLLSRYQALEARYNHFEQLFNECTNRLLERDEVLNTTH